MSMRDSSSDWDISSSEQEAMLADLRSALDEARATTSEYVRRAHDVARDSVKNHPLAAVAIAAFVGAAIGFAVTASKGNSDESGGRNVSLPPPPPPPSVRSEPLTARFERVIDAFSRVDPEAASKSWMHRARDFVRAWMGSGNGS